MEVSFDLVLCEESALEEVAQFAPLPAGDTLVTQILDPVTLIVLHSIVMLTSFDEAEQHYSTPVFMQEPDGPWILAIPEALTAQLATFDDETLAEVAHYWTSTEEIELAELGEELMLALVQHIHALAQRTGHGKSLFLRCMV